MVRKKVAFGFHSRKVMKSLEKFSKPKRRLIINKKNLLYKSKSNKKIKVPRRRYPKIQAGLILNILNEELAI